MNVVSTANMNNYTCSACGKVVVVMTNAPKIEGYKCTCGNSPVTMLKGVVEIKKPVAQNVVPEQLPPSKPGASKPTPPQVFNPSATGISSTPVPPIPETQTK